MKLTEKSNEVFEYVKNNGGKVSIPELAQALDRTERSVGANVTDLTKKGLAASEKVEVQGADKPITFVVLTEARKVFVPREDDE